MLKTTYRWILPLLLMQASASAATVEPLLRVVRTPQAIFAPAQTNTCTISVNGQITIENSVALLNTALSNKQFSAKRVTSVKLLNLANLKLAIDEAAKGTITDGEPILGAEGYSYFAYQKQKNGKLKEIFLLDKNAGRGPGGLTGRVNDSQLVSPLRNFVDSLCGDMSLLNMSL